MKDSIRQKLERLAARHEELAPQVKAATDVALPKGPRVFLIDQPGAVQANLFAGQVVDHP